MDLTCPKCQGAMRTYERSGITVDQCSECRGIFLDRGELERLVDAETSFYGADAAAQPSQPAPQPAAQPAPAQPVYGSPPPQYGTPPGYDRDRDRYERDRYERDRYERQKYGGGYGGGQYGHKRRKKSFLEELFD